MAERHASVVRQVRRRLREGGPHEDTEASLASLISELEGRLARLHRLSPRYARIAVSRHVRNLCKTPAAEGCEGLRVATEA